MRADQIRRLGFGDDADDNAVVGEEAEVDRVGEEQPVHHGPVPRFVVHGDDLGGGVGGSGDRPRGGGQVPPASGWDVLVVMHGGPCPAVR